jgi:hypothetical protein
MTRIQDNMTTLSVEVEELKFYLFYLQEAKHKINYGLPVIYSPSKVRDYV